MAKEMVVKEKPVPELGEGIPDFDLKKVEAEIAQGFREILVPNFRDKKSFKIKILIPSVQSDAECSRVYAEKYNDVLLSDNTILTRGEMEDKLKERGIWTETHENKIKSFDDRVEELMREGQDMHYKKKVNKKRLKFLKAEMQKIQEQKTVMLGKKQTLMAQTIESLSEMASLEHKLFLCTHDENDAPVWDNEEDFKKENNRIVLSKLLQEGIFFWNGLPTNILDLLPEDFLQGVNASEQSQDKDSGKQDSVQPKT